ncbi:hypothetical protein F2Q68_00040621 [Brassica cretica]|uniref:Uncharacterized protein n=1 Tax=Brassica cretica TaxID=69181 RepID=A0A8S9MDL0_BRACR|nr:hypothetical protein F2Q68_00040621 [Brassica cretica]
MTEDSLPVMNEPQKSKGRGQSQSVWRLQASFTDSVEYPPALVLTQKVNILILSM